MKKNPIYQALSIMLRSIGRSLPILRYGLIEDGWLRITNLNNDLRVFISEAGQGTALVDIGLLVKTGDLLVSMRAALNMKVEDFPNKFDTGQREVKISPSVLDGLETLLPAAATDDSRGSLRYVFVNHKKQEAVATNGHVLLLRKLLAKSKESFLIDGLTLKVAACFGENVTRLTICHRVPEKDSDGKSSTGYTYLVIGGNGWQLISHVPNATDYPNYQCVIPNRSKTVSIAWDKSLTAEMTAFLEKTKPFTNPRTHLAMFMSREGVVKNTDLSYFGKTSFSRDIFPLKEKVIGFNGEILQTVLKFISDKPCGVTVGDMMVQPAIWQGEDFLALVMPLRTLEHGEMTRAELLSGSTSVPLAKAA